MTNGTEGGVLHLLRLTRTQCHAWVAFVALRADDGTIEITAVPGAEDESAEWPLETLQGIVRQTLEDPLIGEGRAVIRVSEVFRRYWPGERQYTRMAVAPLNDVAVPGRPWGLLCALDPVDGQFSEPQLDMLGRLAVRFINHLRARRQFVDETAVSDAFLSEALGDEQVERPRAAVPAPEATGPIVADGEPLPDEGILRIERAAAWLTNQSEPAPAPLGEARWAPGETPSAPFLSELPESELPESELPESELPESELPESEPAASERPAGEPAALVAEPEVELEVEPKAGVVVERAEAPLPEPKPVVFDLEAVVGQPEARREESVEWEAAQPASEAASAGGLWREAFTGASETGAAADEEVEVVFGDAFQVKTSAATGGEPAPWAPVNAEAPDEPFGFAAAAPFDATTTPAAVAEPGELAETGTFATASSWSAAETVETAAGAPVAEPEVAEPEVAEPEMHEPAVAEPEMHEPAVRVQTTTPSVAKGLLGAEATAGTAAPMAETVAEPAAAAPPADGGLVPVRKVRLSELVDELESTLDRLRTMQRNGAMFLVELPTELRSPTQLLPAAADRLAEATRSSDLVLAVGGDMVAVVMELGPRPAQPEAIRDRLITASAGDEATTGDLRASTVGLEPQGGLSAEALVLNAVRQLGSR